MTIVQYLCNYLAVRGYPRGYRDSLKSCWGSVVPKKLLKEGTAKLIERRRMVGQTKVKVMWSDPHRAIYKSGDDIWAATSVPAWRRGWKGVISNPEICEVIESYFYFLTQYWSRCQTTPIVAYLMWNYDLDADWVGSGEIKISSEPWEEVASRDRRLAAFLRQVDCRHPLVHNACYHFIRAKRLMQANFVEDAFVNMDCIASLARKRCLELSGQKNDYSPLGINSGQSSMMTSLHNLRSEFAAHPSMTKWWDFSEIFEEEAEAFLELSFNLLLKVGASYHGIAPIEMTYDGITNAPDEFHDCFWFNRIPVRSR